MRKQRLIWLGLALVAGVGAWLRLRGLTTFSLWFDEWITVEQSTRSSLWESITASGTHPPLLRLLVRASIALFGTPGAPGGFDFAARLPSALLGVASIPFVFLFARRWARGSAAVGLTAAALYAMSPYGIYYAQEARYYTGMVLFAAWALHALGRLLEAPRSLWRHVYLAAPLTLGLLNHHLFGLLFLLTFVVTLPHLLFDLRRRWILAAPWVVAGLLFLPWFFFVLGNLEPQARPWLPDLPTQWHDTGIAFFTGRMGAFHLAGSSEGPRFYKPLAQAAWLLLGAGFAVHMIRRWGAPAWRSAVIVGLALGATAALHAGGQTTKFFHHKYLAFLFPFVCLALAELLVYLAGPSGGWSHLLALVRRPPGATGRRSWAIAGLWIAALGLTLITGRRLVPNTVESFGRIRPGAARPFHKERYRETARWVQKHRGKRTLVVVWDPFRQRNNLTILRYYGITEPVVIYKWHQLEHPVTFWPKFASELADARDVIVVTAHCSKAQRRRVETTLAWGFSRRVHTERFIGAEGTIHATVLAPARSGGVIQPPW
jgi:4-amino-4-deoxy-L-arabinose transferase-like glycosyltransferase